MKLRAAVITFLIMLSVLKILLSNATESIEQQVSKQLKQFDHEYKVMWWLHQSADWNYSTNVTKATATSLKFASEVLSNWMKNWKMWARGIDSDALPSHYQQSIRSMASGVVYMNSDDTRIITGIKSKLTDIYSSAKVKIPEMNATVQGESELSSLVKQIRNPQLLKEIWKNWRKEMAEAKPYYLELVQLTNKASQENGYSDVGEAWRRELGLDDAVATVLHLWNEVKDLYKELHAFTKYRLQLLYGSENFGSGPWIPAHLLGSIWGENWDALADVLMPYPKLNNINNITSLFFSEGYNVNKILRKAEEFYTTMGLDPMKANFWKKSMFVKPTDGRVVDCHSVSYDFALKEDYRVRMCGEVKEQSFIEAVHEMGHIQYYMAYHNLPMMQRNGANSAFHESVGETMVYAALSPKCLRRLNITKSEDVSNEMTLNTLMKQALSKFVLLPWSLTVEIWRYRLFSGEITEENMIKKWWELRKMFQGIEAPDEESAEMFDPGSKYHVVMHIPYIRYFLSRFLEHQFLEALCKFSGEPVHSCCFITSEVAGAQLKLMLSLGASVSWQDALESLTGERGLSSRPLMNYYKPLYEWLKVYNNHHNVSVDW